jgi:hypothetical protein
VSNIKVSTTDTPVADWRDFMPLAHAEVAKFFKTQEPGKFPKDDLLGVAVTALAEAAARFDATRNNGLAAYALKGIRGALTDYVRTRDDVVNPVELAEGEYRSKVAELDDCLTAQAARPKPCKIPSDNPLVEEWRKRHRVTLGPPPRRIRRRVQHPFTGKWLELLPSRIATSTGYRVSSKHDKVSVKLGRSTYQEGLEPPEGGCSWKRAKIEDTENFGVVNPRSVTRLTSDSRGEAPPKRGGKSSRKVNLLTLLMAEPHRKHLLCAPSPFEKKKERTVSASATATAEAWMRRFGSVEPEGNFDLSTRRWWPSESPPWPDAQTFGYRRRSPADWLRQLKQDYECVPPHAAEEREAVFSAMGLSRQTLSLPQPVTEAQYRLATKPESAWSHVAGHYSEAVYKRSPTSMLPAKPPLRTKAWWTALEEEGPQCKSALWQREAGRFQIFWGKPAIHEGSGDEYVMRERRVDGETVWLCERVEKLFSPGSYFRHFRGDIYIRDALTVPIAPPLGSGSPSRAAPPLNRRAPTIYPAQAMSIRPHPIRAGDQLL